MATGSEKKKQKKPVFTLVVEMEDLTSIEDCKGLVENARGFGKVVSAEFRVFEEHLVRLD